MGGGNGGNHPLMTINYALKINILERKKCFFNITYKRIQFAPPPHKLGQDTPLTRVSIHICSAWIF